ncbi:MAG: endonuclease III [Candidatus Omnitrophica bacterium]|nr:endonuclease III [Candidatus Omnitrophota bacterium]
MVKIDRVVTILRKEVKRWKVPAVGVIREESGNDPFHVLISCLLSLRTKDEVTEIASRRLFQLGKTPQAFLKLSIPTVEKAIYPVGFYHTKARTIHGVCRDLLSRFHGKVPDSLEDLLTLKGVGRKTANLVVTLSFKKPGICVDTHVHRISNRLGYVKTKTPEETEMALRRKLPKRYWIEFNDLLVPFGQNLCRPISPFCTRCPIERFCSKVGVTHHR